MWVPVSVSWKPYLVSQEHTSRPMVFRAFIKIYIFLSTRNVGYSPRLCKRLKVAQDKEVRNPSTINGFSPLCATGFLITQQAKGGRFLRLFYYNTRILMDKPRHLFCLGGKCIDILGPGSVTAEQQKPVRIRPWKKMEYLFRLSVTVPQRHLSWDELRRFCGTASYLQQHIFDVSSDIPGNSCCNMVFYS